MGRYAGAFWDRDAKADGDAGSRRTMPSALDLDPNHQAEELVRRFNADSNASLIEADVVARYFRTDVRG